MIPLGKINYVIYSPIIWIYPLMSSALLPITIVHLMRNKYKLLANNQACASAASLKYLGCWLVKRLERRAAGGRAPERRFGQRATDQMDVAGSLGGIVDRHTAGGVDEMVEICNAVYINWSRHPFSDDPLPQSFEIFSRNCITDFRISSLSLSQAYRHRTIIMIGNPFDCSA